MQKWLARTKRFSRTTATIRQLEISLQKKPVSWMARQTLRLTSLPTPIKSGRTRSLTIPSYDEPSKHCPALSIQPRLLLEVRAVLLLLQTQIFPPELLHPACSST